jgi:Ser/Thr protein kinase RdoA (MazF antagonist)
MLQNELGRMLGSQVERLERHQHAHRSSFELETLEVLLADGRELRVVRKDLSRRTLDENASWAKPSDLHDPLREISVYADVLSAHELGTAAYYGAVVDPAADRYWLFLEDVPGVPVWQDEDPGIWLAVARGLAKLHQRVRPRGRSLLRYDRALRDRLVAPAAGALPIARAIEPALAELDAMPVGLVHGDFYPANILVDPPRGRICVLDWEAAGVGPGLLDLAALVTGWPEDDVARIAEAYRAALADPPPVAAFRRALDCCRLFVAVRWVGWTRQWSPPPQHAQDWSETARQLAERLAV